MGTGWEDGERKKTTAFGRVQLSKYACKMYVGSKSSV